MTATAMNTIILCLWACIAVGVITMVSGRPRWLDGQVKTDESGETSSYWSNILKRPVKKINSMLNKLLNMADKEEDVKIDSATSDLDSTTTNSRREAAMNR